MSWTEKKRKQNQKKKNIQHAHSSDSNMFGLMGKKRNQK